MKKTFINVAMIGGIILGLISCNKNDKGERPTLILKGPKIAFSWTPGPYDEPGVTATDAEDGDISGDVVITGTIDYNTPGVNYSLNYKVTDSDGNSSDEGTGIQRVIRVVKMNGSYNASTACVNILSVRDSLVFNGHTNFTFSRFGLVEGASVLATLTSDSTFTIASQSFNGSTFSGTGIIEYLSNGGGNTIKMTTDYAVSDSTGSNNCVYNLVKDGD